MQDLAHALHALVAVMDRHAEALVSDASPGLTYPRYLVLLHVCALDRPTQRQVAARVGSSEAALSRMVTGLVGAGLLDVEPGPGNRRSLALTEDGTAALKVAGAALGDSFDALVRSTGLDPDALHETVLTLTEALNRRSI